MPDEVLAKLPTLLNSVLDLLYILDVIEGHDWAKANVQEETRAKLGWPKSRRRRIFSTMKVGPDVLSS